MEGLTAILNFQSHDFWSRDFQYHYMTSRYTGDHVIGIPITYSGRVIHICVSKLTIIGSDDGLLPGRCQAIIWTNAGIVLILTLGTNFNEIISENHTFSLKKMHLKMSAKWWQFCLSLNVITGIPRWQLWYEIFPPPHGGPEWLLIA